MDLSTAFSTSPLSGGANLVQMDPNGYTGFSTNSFIPGGFGDGFHMSSTFESDPFNADSFDSITQAINAMNNISEERRVISWQSLIDPRSPDESASRVNAALSKIHPSYEVYEEIASCMTTPDLLPVVASLDDPHKKQVRGIVLQKNMDQLGVSGEDPMPLAAEMLVEMAKLGLVRLPGMIAVIETFLEKPQTRRAGLAMLGRILDQLRDNKRFIASVRSNKSISMQLYKFHNCPEYEYDVIAISQLMTNNTGGSNGNPTLHEGPVLRHSGAPTTRIQYFGARDELVSAHLDGTVVLWGDPGNSMTAMQGTLDMPNACIPWAMAGPRQGSYLVLSGKPLPQDSSYGQFSSMRKRHELSSSKGPMSRKPVLCILDYNGGLWKAGQIIERPLTTTLTAVAALPNSVVCSAETQNNVESGLPGRQHEIVFFHAGTGQHLRTIQQAHSDYVTVLATCAESAALLFSGSRDRTVKLFDARVQQQGAGKGGSVVQLPNTHTDTITSISTLHDSVITTSLDGTLLIWDRRKLNEPLVTRAFSSPVLSTALLGNGESLMAVGTARGLYLVTSVSKSYVVAMDIVPNKAHTQLVSNADGSVLFAADTEGIHVYGVKN